MPLCSAAITKSQYKMYVDKICGKAAQARGERPLALALYQLGPDRQRMAKNSLGLRSPNGLGYTVRDEKGQISRLVREYRGSGYPSSALSIDKYVLCGKRKK